MNKSKKTEIVEEAIYQALVELNQEYEGEIHVVSESDYLSGKIKIKIMD